MNKSKFYWFWILILPIQWGFIQYLSLKPAYIENIYALNIYPKIGRFSRSLLGWIPFSIGDILYLFILFLVIKFIINIFRKRKVNLIKIIAHFSILYFLFQLLWGLNYLRQPIDQSLQISKLTYTTEELDKFTNNLIDKINEVQFILTKNDTIKVTIPYSKKEIYSMVQNGFQNVSYNHKHIYYKQKSIKHSLISLPLSYMGFSGYLNPFTGEAQVNSLNPLISYPVTSCHEVAHQLGYAAENEANFIGYLTSVNNDDLYFQYSGYYLALRYALNDLYKHDLTRYKSAIKRLHKGVVKNMKESQLHWAQFKNPLEPFFKSIFNQFLKANQQTSGIKSYNLMIGLLINYEDLIGES